MLQEVSVFMTSELGSLRGETPQERGSKGVSPLIRLRPGRGPSLVEAPSPISPLPILAELVTRRASG